MIIINGREASIPSTTSARISLLLWGAAGCGKTTLAATAPGKKLWLLFDPDGANSLIGRDDVHVVDLSGEKHIIVTQMMQENPLRLEQILTENPDITTVVFDSLTAYSILATENAISGVKSATTANPGLKGYGHRNAVVLRSVVSLMRLTKRMNKHIILIAHEDSPTVNDDGHVIHISVALGGKMTSSIGMQLSEIWWLNDTGKQHRIAIRNVRQRMPMKSRMFDLREGEFTWNYDPNTFTGDGIDTWFAKWQANEGKKIPTPR
jgi:phage nucleotide-binding protein